MNQKIRTYSELIKIPSFIERFRYLKLGAKIGEETFGTDRWINQGFYKSAEWRHIRNQIIIRDNGCDLGVEGCTIPGRVIIHHMNPITTKDILDYTDYLTNPEYLICVSELTHEAIHFGNESLLGLNGFVERKANDTCPWK